MSEKKRTEPSKSQTRASGSRRIRRPPDVVLLDDLAPRQEVKAGKGKLLFGQPAKPEPTE